VLMKYYTDEAVVGTSTAHDIQGQFFMCFNVENQAGNGSSHMPRNRYCVVVGGNEIAKKASIRSGCSQKGRPVSMKVCQGQIEGM